jgi:hypothetical protein
VNKLKALSDARVGDVKRLKVESDGLGWIEEAIQTAISKCVGDEDYEVDKQQATIRLAHARYVV